MVNHTISPRDYEAFRDFLKEACGIVLGDNKQYLINSRLKRLLEEFNLKDLGALVESLRRNQNPRLRGLIIDAMTTNETYWFRDQLPFDMLKEVVFPQLAKQNKRQVKIWSAACSSGQEPYSISMTFQEYLQQSPATVLRDAQVVATDISPAILKLSKEAIYDDLALSRGLSPERKVRYFEPKDNVWQVKDAIRQRVSFRELNLMHSFGSLGKFDVIFCRNVLIYFSPELKRDILARLSQALEPNGFLFLGGSESMASYSEHFETVRHGRGMSYRLRSAG